MLQEGGGRRERKISNIPLSKLYKFNLGTKVDPKCLKHCHSWIRQMCHNYEVPESRKASLTLTSPNTFRAASSSLSLREKSGPGSHCSETTNTQNTNGK